MVGDRNDVVKNFIFAINSTDETVLLSKCFSSADLFHIGYYDCTTGEVAKCEPVLVKKGSESRFPDQYVNSSEQTMTDVYASSQISIDEELADMAADEVLHG